DLDEQEPLTGSDGAVEYAAASEEDYEEGADATDRAQYREDGGEGVALQQVEAIGLRVDVGELPVDRVLLAEGLGDRDAGYRLLHVGVDVGQHAPGLLCDAPGDAPERQRYEHDHGRYRQRHERQPGVYIEQYAREDHQLQGLADEVEG